MEPSTHRASDDDDDDVAALADLIARNTTPADANNGRAVFGNLSAGHTLTVVYAPGGRVAVSSAAEKKGR